MQRIINLNIIILTTNKTSNNENDDVVFENIFKGIKAKRSEKILNIMYGVVIIDDGHTNKYYVIQQRSEQYILQQNKFLEYYDPLIKAYTYDIVRDVLFYNHAPNTKY